MTILILEDEPIIAVDLEEIASEHLPGSVFVLLRGTPTASTHTYSATTQFS